MQRKTVISAETKKDKRILIEHKRLYGTEAVWLRSINNVATAACKDKTTDEIFRLIGTELSKLGYSSVFFIREPGEECLVASNLTLCYGGFPAYDVGFQGREKMSISLVDNEIITRVLSSGDVVLTTQPGSLAHMFPTIPRDVVAPEDPLSYVCAPLRSTADALGVLVAAGPKMSQSEASNIALFARFAFASHSNNRLVAEMDNMRWKIECLDKGFGSAVSALDKSIQDLVYALTIPMVMRDPYTSGHQTRVTRLAVAIAEEMGVAQHHIDGLRLAASIHDLGKIVIPFEILNRPTRLSEAEFNLIKMHPQVAFDMLSPISFQWPVAEIVRQHHERIDGSGYPCGLKSEQILLEAKILAVADVVEAMSSHRPYRASLGIDAALDEISSKSGIAYDSEAVAACVRLLLIQNFSLDSGLSSTLLNTSHSASVKGQ